mmetsp:Transcript_157846/g.383284  ORF Transcript_157846/g.383284 Transcript_157846/m.383284 type:complete len:238 (-) Transcript_157846:874-1587(-)
MAAATCSRRSSYSFSFSASPTRTRSGTLVRYVGAFIFLVSVVMALSSCASFLVSFLTSTAGSMTPLSMMLTERAELTTWTAQPTGASPSMNATLSLSPSVAMSSVKTARTSRCDASAERMKMLARCFGVRPADARRDRMAPTTSRIVVMLASPVSSRHAAQRAASGQSEIMIDAGSGLPAVWSRPRPGRRCHSSSVTNGIIGCSSFRPWSRQMYRTCRASVLASSSSPRIVGLMSSR